MLMVMQIAAHGPAASTSPALDGAPRGTAQAASTHPPAEADRAGTPAERAVRGEPGAFAELYDRHVDRVYRFATFRLGDSDLAADVTHDVFVAALRSVRELRDPGRFELWLMRIAHRRVLNEWRRRARQPDAASLDDGWTDDAGAGSGEERQLALAEDPHEGWDRRMDLSDLVAGATRLSDAQRQVLALRFVAGLSLEETAAVVERSEDAVKKLQRRALRALRVAAAAGSRP